MLTFVWIAAGVLVLCFFKVLPWWVPLAGAFVGVFVFAAIRLLGRLTQELIYGIGVNKQQAAWHLKVWVRDAQTLWSPLERRLFKGMLECWTPEPGDDVPRGYHTSTSSSTRTALPGSETKRTAIPGRDDSKRLRQTSSTPQTRRTTAPQAGSGTPWWVTSGVSPDDARRLTKLRARITAQSAARLW
jgi:hypothetical protein